MGFRSKVVLILYTVIFLGMTLSLAYTDSHHYHSGEHILNGLLYLNTGNSFNTAGKGMITSILVSLPLLFTNVDVPSLEELNSNPKEFALFKFLYYRNNNLNQIVFLAVIPQIILALILGFYVYKWARELYGENAGIIALILYAFFPVILGYTGLITLDIVFTCFFVISFYYLWKFVTSNKVMYLIISGILLGLMFHTKPNFVFIIPVFVLCLILSFVYGKNCYMLKNKSKFRNFLYINLVLFLISFSVFVLIFAKEIHPIYYADDPLYKGAVSVRSIERLDLIVEDIVPIKSEFIKKMVKYFVTEVPVPGPHFFQGLYTIGVYSLRGEPAYLNQEYVGGYQWKTYLYSYFVKTPISFFIFILISLGLLIKFRGRFNELFLLIPVAIFILSLVSTKMYGGYRYFMPIIPLLIVFCSRVINFKPRNLNKRIIYRILILLILMWFIINSVNAYPGYLAYFNEFVGMENGYKVLIASDLDYYQDFKRLEKYVRANNLSDFKMNVTASMVQSIYKFDFDYGELPVKKPVPGLVIVNVNSLMGLKERNSDDFKWLRNFEPIDIIGSSIFVYNLSEEEIKRLK